MDLSELVEFPAGVSLRIVEAIGGGWRVSEGHVGWPGDPSSFITKLVPPINIAMRLHRTRGDAIAAARDWLEERG